MNVGTFSGYVARDAEFKMLESGSKVLNFSLGVNIGFGDNKETLWVSVALWGDRGEKLSQYIQKGTSLTVSGDVTVRAYSAKDGSPKAELICNAQRLTLQGSARSSEVKTPPEKKAPPTKPDFDNGEEIPF